MAYISYEDLKGAKLVEFNVTISGMPYFQEWEKDGAKQIKLIIPGVTADGRTAEGTLWLSNERQDKGKNAGKTKKEIAYQQCYDLGMSAPFSPHKIGEMVGSSCVFVMEPHVYTTKGGDEKKVAQVKYVNTVSSRPALSTEKVNGLFKELFGDTFEDAPEAAATSEAGETTGAGADISELPF